MIPRTLHAMTPGHLPILKQELSSYLSEVSAGEHVPARPQLLEETAQNHGNKGALHVFR